MRRQEQDPSADIARLFEALVKELREARCVLSLGSESFAEPYALILNRPERRTMAAAFTPALRTTVRLYPPEAYRHYLDNAFPRLYGRLAAECQPDRPFLVVESSTRYIRAGKRLLEFARRHGLNLRYVDFALCESRLNGLRIYFDTASHRWRAVEGAVDELLKDPRRHDRSVLASWNPTWSIGRAADRLSGSARRAAAIIGA